MQATADRPLSDEESISHAVSGWLANVNVVSDSGTADEDALKTFAASYNPNPDYYPLLSAAYQSLVPYEPLYASVARADDYSRVIEVLRCEALGDVVLLEGTAVAYEASLELLAHRRGAAEHVASVTTSMGAPARGRWKAVVNIPEGTEYLVIREPSMEETPQSVSQDRSVKVLIDASN
jgi:hypothetical protein